ncbi:MAG: polymer-forming cytoskeletal protein [Balneolaceae bacterium]|nr:polymer-forming cytoskeletal protein [Balneolaceae bacterium]MCH8547501.1 polymer-forming cytoskeletal protein [Balneolaceae bacterium]
MFNNKNNKKSKTVSGTSSQSPALNMISEGSKLKGTINSQNDIRIAGFVEGEAIAKGKLIVTSSGVIDGEVNVGEADIAGKIDGTIRVTGKLNLRQSAVINGDIFTKTLVVEEGAQMNGACKMGVQSEASGKSATPAQSKPKSEKA